MTELSKVRPDYDDLVAQLISSLQSKDAWKDRVVSSTGKTLVDFIAAIGAYSQYSTESAYQEVWPESAKNKESLYAAANFAGVRFNRKTPNRLRATLTSVAPQTLPPYTQFSINGTFWFNRDPVSLSSTPSDHSLFQGQVIEHQMNGIGSDFQAFVGPETNFTVSDSDVQVFINGGAIPTQMAGLWTLPGLPGCQQFTLPNGQAIFVFGNDLYGSKPTINDTVTVRYAITFGADGNNLPVLNQPVNVPDNLSVQGTVIAITSEGSNQTDPFIYKNITPALFGSFDSAVTAAQYKATPLNFPGVIDAQTFAQREINPKALTWMNNIRVVLLTTTPWDNTQWEAFRTWFQDRTMYKCQFIRKDPTPFLVNVDIDVFCANFSDLAAVKAKVQTAIQNLFTPRQGIIGFDFYKHDIGRVADAADPNIEYVVLNTPTTDIILSSLNVKAPTLTANTGGFLPAGTYDYAISATSTLGGATAPANWSTVTTSAPGGQIIIAWPPAPNVLFYSVWGRVTGGAFGLLAELPASTLAFIDNGTVTPVGTVPVEATVGNFYAKLNVLNVKTSFTTRPVRIDNE